MAAPDKTPDLDALATEAKEGALLHRLWLLMLTRNLWMLACAIGVVMFLGSVAFDIVLLKHEAPLVIVASNGLVAALASALVFTLLVFGREQRRQLMERMAALNEVNHHIRNALQALAFSAGALKGTKEGAVISEAIQRIQWALHEVLPKVEPQYEPFQGSARQSSQTQVASPDPEARGHPAPPL